MAKVTYEVQFRGTATISFDPNDYSHYSGTEKRLAEDLFFDYAELKGAPFEAGDDFFEAYVQKIENPK